MKIAKLLLITLWVGALPARAEVTLVELDWAEADAPAGAVVVETDRGWRAARFVWEGEGPKTFALARLAQPGITANRYAVTAEVRYEGVAAGSYLEMWNHLPGGGAFFSRTLANSGPMGALGGSSPWRAFSLPAFLQDHPERPATLEINLVLTGPGVVEIGPLTLSQPGAGESADASLAGGTGSGAWWSPRTAGLIGGLGGAGVGLLGALLGALVGLGRARPVVTFLAVLLLVAGIGALALGGFALLASQPYAVYYPLLLMGAMTTLFMAAILFAAPHRYRMLELRRMRAMDAS